MARGEAQVLGERSAEGMGGYFLAVDDGNRSIRLSILYATMALAFGGVMNIVTFFRSGFEGFGPFGAWAVGVAIYACGLIWNVITAIGRAMTTDQAPTVACGAFTPERKPTPA